MKQILSFVLIALVASMIIGLPTSFADSKLDSLVNIATKARAQVKFQLERSQNVSDETKALFEQGSQQTDLLISAVEQGKVTEAKQYFLSIMKIFKQVTVELAGPPQDVSLKATPVAPSMPVPQINYKNDIDRTEKYVSMLKNLAAKNNFAIDFGRIDGLIKEAKSSLANNDIPSVEKIYGELKAALADIQNAIRQQTEEQQNNRARSFANGYIVKIDATLGQAKELGLSEDAVARLIQAKEEISSINDPNQIIIKIREVDSVIKEIEINIQSKKAQVSTQAEEPRVESEKTATEPKQEKQKEDVKAQRNQAEVERLEARLANIKPYVDENIDAKFERANSLLSKLKTEEMSTPDYLKTLRMADLLINSMERYVESLQNQDRNNPDNSANSGVEQEIKIRPSEKEKQKPDRGN
jgi:hypothetical protein